MDYEKAYKEALERARKIKNGEGDWRYSDLIEITPALTEIFPELRESEDERIRKALIQEFKGKVQKSFEWKDGIPNNAVLAWLEKQKPSAPNDYDEKMRKKIIDHLESIKMGCVICTIDTSEEIAWLEKQKEQNLIPSNSVGLKEPKPVEWSERHIADVFEKVGLAKIVREQGNDNLTNALQSAMIELASPAEWSEEDEKMRDSILAELANHICYNKPLDGMPSGTGWTSYKYQQEMDWLTNRLKPLRTCPSWKPSEDEESKNSK